MINKHQLTGLYPIRTPRKNQSGAILIVSLIMLLLITIIGVTGSQVTGLEEKMAGNMRDQNSAFQSAEAGLRAGEATTANSLEFSCVGSNGYFDRSTATACATAAPYWQTFNWSDTNRTVTFISNTINYAYYIEKLDPTIETNTGLEAGGFITETASAPTWYRITARGISTSSNAVAYLQSTFIR